MVNAWPRAPTRHEVPERDPTRLWLHLTAPCKGLDPTAANSCLTPQPGPGLSSLPQVSKGNPSSLPEQLHAECFPVQGRNEQRRGRALGGLPRGAAVPTRSCSAPLREGQLGFHWNSAKMQSAEEPPRSERSWAGQTSGTSWVKLGKPSKKGSEETGRAACSE